MPHDRPHEPGLSEGTSQDIVDRHLHSCILGKHKTALSLLKNVPEASLDWELLEQLGDIHLYLKDLTSAKECYLQALQKGSNKNIILKLGKLYLKEGNTSETKDLFSKYAER